ncbi:MAG: ferritin-like domain-containing protein [Thermoleophilaceae bacterium]
MPIRLTRRGALGGAAALALASCGGGDPPPAGRPQAGSGAGLLNSIVALEHAGVAAWAAIAGVLDGEDRAYARAIRAREQAHVERVSALVRALGGTPPAGRPQSEYERMFPRMSDPADALHFARDLEARLVRAYLDALRSLPDTEQRRTAAEIAAEEAEDLAVVHVLAGTAAAPEAFVTGTS